MDDKIIQNQIAIFNLMGALFYKVTGQIPTVSIEQENGSYLRVTPSISNIILTEEHLQYSGHGQKGNSKDVQPHAFSGVS